MLGLGDGKAPAVPAYTAARSGDLDMTVCINEQEDTVGYNILFGASEDKLYHSMMVFAAGEHRVGALVAGRAYCVRVDAFNENGITEGICKRVEAE